MSDSRIKIAYVLTPITFGGAEKVSLNFLKTVDRDQFDIRVALLVRPWEESTLFAREIQRLGYADYSIPVALKTGSDLLRVPRVAHGLYSFLKGEDFNLVHCHGYFADICGLSVARILCLPSISTCHGYIDNDLKLRIYNRLDKYVLRLCRTVIAVSEGIKTELVGSGIRESRITVIPNAVAAHYDTDELQARRLARRCSLGIASHEHVVGYIGRLSEEKGLAYLIEAIATMGDAAGALKLIIVGDGPARPGLEELTKKRGIDGRVIFPGFQKNVEDWFPAFDVFALPSLAEGTPLALLEAMAMGVPVIASRVGGIPKVVMDGVNGLLVPPGNPQEICEKVKILNSNPALALRLRSAGTDAIKAKYSLDSWCRSIEECYCRIHSFMVNRIRLVETHN
jgi:glycosyltransferase involved in cell wall biosynthesis